MTPHPLTIASIELQGVDCHATGAVYYRCGCAYVTRTGRWRLCQYHEGHEDGIEALLAEMRKADES